MKKRVVVLCLIFTTCIVLQSCNKPTSTSSGDSSSDITSTSSSDIISNESIDESTSSSDVLSGESATSSDSESIVASSTTASTASIASSVSTATSISSNPSSSSSAGSTDILQMPTPVTKIYPGDTKTQKVWINAGPVENKLKKTKTTFFIDNGIIKYFYDGAVQINSHADIIFATTPNTAYVLKAKVKGDNITALMMCKVADWAIIGYDVFKNTADWTDVWVTFNSGADSNARFCWYGGNNGTQYQAIAGTAWIKDVKVEKDVGTNVPKKTTVIGNGDFSKNELLLNSDIDGVWGINADLTLSGYTIETGGGPGGMNCIKYFNDTKDKANWSIQQIINVEKRTDYKITFKVKGKAVANITTTTWAKLKSSVSPNSTDWKEVTLEFNSSLNTKVRINVFGGATKEYEANKGTAYFTDFKITKK